MTEKYLDSGVHFRDGKLVEHRTLVTTDPLSIVQSEERDLILTTTPPWPAVNIKPGEWRIL